MDERLIQYIERIERLMEEKQGIADDIKDEVSICEKSTKNWWGYNA